MLKIWNKVTLNVIFSNTTVKIKVRYMKFNMLVGTSKSKRTLKHDRKLKHNLKCALK